LGSSSSNLVGVLRPHHLVLPLASQHSLRLRSAKLLRSGSSRSSRQMLLGSKQPLGKQQHLQQHLARQLGLGRQRHQQHRSVRQMHLVLLRAAHLVEALLHLLLLQARPLGQVAAALRRLLHLKPTQGLARSQVAALHSEPGRLGVPPVPRQEARLVQLHPTSSPACGVGHGVECCVWWRFEAG
jgi:hypothetical protein